MRIHQRIRRSGVWTLRGEAAGPSDQLALVFSTGDILAQDETWQQLRAFYPVARIVACSTAGEIAGVNVYDDSIVCTALSFERRARNVRKHR